MGRADAVAAGDPVLRTKLYAVPELIADWTKPHGGLAGRRILDFGCGLGEAAAGVALGYEPAEVLGVDIRAETAACIAMLREHFGLEGLPPNLAFATVTEGEIAPCGGFDLIYSWSVMEHVERGRLDAVIGGLHDHLRPGGLLFVQIAPLYFSAEGAHLWAVGYRDWEHLTRQLSEIQGEVDACADLPEERRPKLWKMFQRLNRITAPELIRRLEAAGFTLLREHREQTDRDPPPHLLDAYTVEALKTFQIVLLMQKSS